MFWRVQCHFEVCMGLLLIVHLCISFWVDYTVDCKLRLGLCANVFVGFGIVLV